jgi:hypothetical protein
VKIWLVTTGSSDIQITTDEFWNDWYRVVKRDCYDLPAEKIKPKQVIEDKDEPYRVVPRILGQIYSAQPEQVWKHLRFPLLDAFTAKLQHEDIDQVILLLTDQSLVFGEQDRDEVRCPFWQDTCALLPLFERYFAESFLEAEVKVLTLKPQTIEQGLDDWNEVLTIVRTALGEIQIEPEVAYVSHQAGTPAISSAVQFVSLSRFRSGVQFLVSNEYRTERTQLIIERSSYLLGIQLQEAKALLRSYDYAGVKKLLKPYLNPEAEQLLNAAIQWNCSKFDEFACLLGTISSQRTETWWWTAYEAAYLAVIRHRQEDIVDAFFHSFRAIEGAFSEWGKNEFKAHTKIRNERPYLQATILLDPNSYFLKARFKQDGAPKNSLAVLNCKLNELGSEGKDTILYGENLYPLFRSCREEYKQACPELSEFWDSNNGIAEKRNKIFHQLKGLSEFELVDAWNVKNIDSWQPKILSYLNFITGQQHFTSLSEASLMGQVHIQLESMISSLVQNLGQ